MPTQAEATKAAAVYRATQPAIDALKATVAENDAAKKTLGAYMVEKDLTVFKGVTFAVSPTSVWDWPALIAFVGDKAGELHKPGTRRYFGLVKRAAKAKAPADVVPAAA